MMTAATRVHTVSTKHTHIHCASPPHINHPLFSFQMSKINWFYWLFGMINQEKIWHNILQICPPHLSDVATFNSILTMPSVLWRCWLGGRKGIRPVKTEWWGAGVVICLERDADLHMAQLMPLPLTVSCFSRIQIGFTFLVPAHPGSPQWRIAKNGGGYTQTGVAKGWRYPAYLSLRWVYAVKKTRRLVYAVYPRIPPIHHW